MESQFRAAGQKVALISHHWNRRIMDQRTIAKVHVSGNFTLVGGNGKADPQQWKPSYDGTTARRTGEHHYSEHLEPWGPEIEQELAGARQKCALEGRRRAVVRHLEQHLPSAVAMAAVEAALGMKKEAV